MTTYWSEWFATRDAMRAAMIEHGHELTALGEARRANGCERRLCQDCDDKAGCPTYGRLRILLERR